MTKLPPTFEKWWAKNLSWNLDCGLSETKMVSFRPCAWFSFTISCWRAVTPFGTRVFDDINNLYEWGSWKSRVSHSVAHESHKPTTNTLKHGGFEIGSTESHPPRHKKISNHATVAVRTPRLEWPVALVGYAMFATVAGASVTVDGTNTAGCSGHVF